MYACWIHRRWAALTLMAAPALAALPPSTGPLGLLRTLPAARKAGGRPLMQVLAARHSTREYQAGGLSDQQLADLLWAACGINRPSGDRTAPYWRHLMVLDVYAAMADGLWLYEPSLHALRLQHGADLRALTGTQDFAATVPLNLVYVVHGERMQGLADAERRLYGTVDAAFAGQNVYLYCASEGLGCVCRAALDTAQLGQAMKLPAGQFVAFAQTVGIALA